MSLDTSFTESVDALRDRYRLLDLIEEDTKRALAEAEINLKAVRELKERIGKQIFTQQTVSSPTSNNGQNRDAQPV